VRGRPLEIWVFGMDEIDPAQLPEGRIVFER
jgi:hypothetical protein